MQSGVRAFGAAVALFTCSSCLIGIARTVDYEFATSATRLTSGVETPLDTSSSGRAVDLIASDDIASFSFDVRLGSIIVAIRDKASQPLRLLLEEGRYTDSQGKEHRLYVAGPRQRGKAPDRVEPGSEVKVFLWPQEWMRCCIGGRPNTWVSDLPFDGGIIAERTREEALERGSRYIGRTFEILLPVDLGTTRHLYRFRFTARSIHAHRILWA